MTAASPHDITCRRRWGHSRDPRELPGITSPTMGWICALFFMIFSTLLMFLL
jgi:hypothetical protein